MDREFKGLNRHVKEAKKYLRLAKLFGRRNRRIGIAFLTEAKMELENAAVNLDNSVAAVTHAIEG